MRELAGRLGVEAASLYNHISGKEDLLNGMADLAIDEIEVPGPEVDWKRAMRGWAASARDVFWRHRWAASLIESRDRTSPRKLSYVDRVLSALFAAGFTPQVAAQATLVLDCYIHSFEGHRSNHSEQGAQPGIATAQEVLAGIPDGAYTAAAQVATDFVANPFDEDAAFDFGLGLILDGLERLLGTSAPAGCA
jgi:AcrR family transcriptional regulator